MTRFEYFESGQALAAVRMGVANADWLSKYDVYKFFLDRRRKGDTRTQAIMAAADYARCHYTSVYRYVCWFEEEGLQFPAKGCIAV